MLQTDEPLADVASHTTISTSRFERMAIWIVATFFVLWSALFIYRTSFVAIDGHRYFCLFDDAMISMRYAWNWGVRARHQNNK